MFGLMDIRSGLNLVNPEYRQLVADNNPNLVVKLAYLKDMDDVYPF